MHAITVLLLCFVASTAPAEEWECWDTYDRERRNVLIQLGTNPTDKNSGWVEAAGVRQGADYRVTGVNRRWDFGYTIRDSQYKISNYAFVIKQTGYGAYYDFTTSDDGTADASQFYRCRIK